jgi:chromatin segregation and condensation protein Rec8/ScpA/Scc1 (kleisin family)
MEVVEDLKNELRSRDQEYEQMRSRVEKLEALNTELAKRLLDEKLEHVEHKARLNKLTTLKELDRNFAQIESG